MRRYYFDVWDDNGLSVDDEGVECLDMHSVQNEAARALADMARDVVYASTSVRHRMSIEVRDDAGPVMRVRFTFEVNGQD
jgi:hypothetical protein